LKLGQGLRKWRARHSPTLPLGGLLKQPYKQEKPRRTLRNPAPRPATSTRRPTSGSSLMSRGCMRP
jgi:hypothetical protein